MLLVIFFLISSSTFAYTPEEGNITASLGPYFYKTNFKDAKTDAKSPYLTGLGLIVNGDISNKGSLEIGMFHMNKRFLRREGPSYLSEQTQVIHITMGYKWWLSRYLSTSMALFSAYPMGKIRVLYSNFPSGESVKTSARDTTEYGFDFAIQSQLWSGEKFDAVAELRYSLSLTSRTKEEADHYGGFVGIRYLIQEKNPDKEPEKKKYE